VLIVQIVTGYEHRQPGDGGGAPAHPRLRRSVRLSVDDSSTNPGGDDRRRSSTRPIRGEDDHFVSQFELKGQCHKVFVVLFYKT
jgi:hypothetical protein